MKFQIAHSSLCVLDFFIFYLRVLIDTAANFPNSCEEVTLGCTPEHLTFRNYLEDEPGSLHCTFHIFNEKNEEEHIRR